MLTDYNGQAITYDEIGNPLTMGTKSFTWDCRTLQSITDGENTYSYRYNGDGQRVSKTVNGVKTDYYYNGSILAGQKTGDEVLSFMYDENGVYFGFIYNGEDYYFIKNLQNDVEAISDKDENIVVRYTYDAWGNVNEISGSQANTLGKLNPIRYRSYYYDSDSHLVRVDNEYTENSTTVYTYDIRGNITAKKIYPFTRDETITSAPTETKNFTYANSGWKDQLIKVNY